MPSQRILTLCVTVALAVPALDGSQPGDCAFDPADSPPPQEIWRRISRQAELLSATTGRRRAAAPPPLAIPRRNFIDDTIF